MEPNFRDTPIRRFNTFWWGLALFLAFAIVAVLIKNLIANDVVDQETEKGKARAVTFRKITMKQDKARNTYKDNGDGTVQVRPEDVFGLGKEMGLLNGPQPFEMKHNRTFTDK